MRLAVLALAGLATLALAACDSALEVQPCADTSPLTIVDSLEVTGTGQAATAASVVRIFYRGTLTDGTVFDSTRTASPSAFSLSSTIAGFRFGIGGTDTFPAMRIGGSRRIVVPPTLGYGTVERPGIPACSTLLFDIELVDLG